MQHNRRSSSATAPSPSQALRPSPVSSSARSSFRVADSIAAAEVNREEELESAVQIDGRLEHLGGIRDIVFRCGAGTQPLPALSANPLISAAREWKAGRQAQRLLQQYTFERVGGAK